MKLPIPLPAHLADVFTTRDALDSGVTSSRMRRTDLLRPAQGVRMKVAIQADPSSFQANPSALQADPSSLCLAIQQSLPAHSRFCGVTAAQLLGVPLPHYAARGARIHVAVPAPATAPTGRAIAGHSFDASLGDSMAMNGLRISSAEHTWYELAATLWLLDLVAAGDYLIHDDKPFTTREGLASLHNSFAGRRGIRRARQALELLNEYSESPQESKLRVILIHGGISATANLPITTSGGYNYRVDLAIPERLLVIEYQSDKYHMDAAAFRRDMTRISRLEADGWYVIQFNANDLYNSAEVCARVRRVLAGRPLVRYPLT